ncbi:MAG: DUF3501 family protein [Planctomycetota bacterium]|jgi:hypothetical protein
MKTVDRSELLDFETYSDSRDSFRNDVMAVKAPRRIHVAPCLTFLFENALTIRYQVQEMMRVERIVKEADIQHELETYNGLLGGDGELGCSLLIEIKEPAERDVKLVEWIDLPQHLYCLLEDGTKVRATYDEGQVGDGRLSSVQYLKFDVKGQVPVAIGTDLDVLTEETTLTDEQRAALAEDLAG